MAGARFDLSLTELRNGQRRSGLVGAVQHYFRRLGDYLRSPDSMLEEVGETLQSSTKQRFITETDPTGKKWAPNRPATLASYFRRRGAGSKKILTDSGTLGDSIRYQLTGGFSVGSWRSGGGRSVTVGTNLVYGAMQQYGGTRARFPHLWGDIPARPYLGVSRDDRARINAIVGQYIRRVS